MSEGPPVRPPAPGRDRPGDLGGPDQAAEGLLDDLDPARGALLVVDMQNDFCHPAGAVGAKGVDLGASLEALGRLSRFCDEARDQGMLVVFIRLEADPETVTDALRLVAAANGRPAVSVCLPGTWGAQIHEALPVGPDDLVVTKRLYSAFAGTGLQEQLADRGVDHVVVGGTTANVCVQATAMDAYLRNFSVVVPRDLVGFINPPAAEAALANLAGYYALVCRSPELSAAWRRRSSRGAPVPESPRETT